jgi:hypothetical protein
MYTKKPPAIRGLADDHYNVLPQYGQFFQSAWAGLPQLAQVRVGAAGVDLRLTSHTIP